jgi:hypothetical protein
MQLPQLGSQECKIHRSHSRYAAVRNREQRYWFYPRWAVLVEISVRTSPWLRRLRALCVVLGDIQSQFHGLAVAHDAVLEHKQ